MILFMTSLYVNLKSLLYARVYDLMNMPEEAYHILIQPCITLESRVMRNPDDPRLYSAKGIA